MPYQRTDDLTQSKLLSFGCPARYKKLHVEKLEDTSDPARRGSTIHKANELYVTGLAADGMESDAGLAGECFAEAITHENTPAHLVPECETLWANHVERFELNLSAFLEAEQRRATGKFSIKPDYVYALPDELQIHDLKTHYQSLTEKAAKADLQARMYAWAASKLWPGFSVYSFTFHFIRLFQSVTVHFEPAELDAIERQLDAHAEAIERAAESGEYPAAPGANCAFCNFACPIVDDPSRLPMRLLTAEDAVREAGEVLAFRQAVAAKSRALEAFCGLNGPVVAGGMEWAFRPVEKMSFPAAQVIDTLRGKGVDTAKLSLGKTALKSYLTAKKWAFIKPLLEMLAVTVPGTKFSAKKVGAVGEEPTEGEDA